MFQPAERFYRWIAGGKNDQGQQDSRLWSGTFYSAYKPYTIPAFKTWVSNNS